MSIQICSCILLSLGSSQTCQQLHIVIPKGGGRREGEGEREREGGREGEGEERERGKGEGWGRREGGETYNVHVHSTVY